MRIVLIRHGRVDLPAWPPIHAGELGRWISAYNAAGIKDAPPPAVRTVAWRCRVIVTSDLPRSVRSGSILAAERPMLSQGLFREVGLPYRTLPFFRLPPPAWALLFRLLWAFGYHRNGEPERLFRARARQAAGTLISLARDHGSVLFVGHGLINAYITRELLSSGWKGPRRPGVRHWSWTSYCKGEDNRHDL